MQRISRALCLVLLAAAVLGSSIPMWSAIQVTLSPSAASPQPVGTSITWTATASDTSAGALVYRFAVVPSGGAFTIVRDFATTDSFTWTDSTAEGSFQIIVTVMNLSTNQLVSTAANFAVTPVATASLPVVVSPTANPLVALYSTTVCPVGYQVAVAFQAIGDLVTQYTPAQVCQGTTMNIYIAGMKPNTLYIMTAGIFAGGVFWPITSGVAFLTGSISSVTFPTLTLLNAAPAAGSARPILLHSYIGTGFTETATDLAGNVIWYYATTGTPFATQPEPGGKMWMMFLGSNDPYLQPLREIDLAGNTLVETNPGAVNLQLVAMGAQPITSFHHEARRLANGNILVFGSVERMSPTVQGGADVLGDEIIILNSNLQVLWTWNAFDHLDVNRAAILGEQCGNLAPGCPPVKLATVANDWLHSNAADVGSDGNIIMSLRHQDWIIKIDYRNGAGTGNILWRLGNQGDFTINSSDPNPWFSHQHNIHWELGGTQYLSLFDNGNTRHASDATAHSRGQLLSINDASKQASLIVNFDLGIYSTAVGTAQMLWDGPVIGAHYEAGAIDGPGLSQSITFYPTGTLDLQSKATTYRTFQMKSMYVP